MIYRAGYDKKRNEVEKAFRNVGGLVFNEKNETYYFANGGYMVEPKYIRELIQGLQKWVDLKGIDEYVSVNNFVGELENCMQQVSSFESVPKNIIESLIKVYNELEIEKYSFEDTGFQKLVDQFKSEIMNK